MCLAIDETLAETKLLLQSQLFPKPLENIVGDGSVII